MANPSYFYGSFALNDNVSYFVMEKPYDIPPFTQTLFKIARLEGMKKTGETINERIIQIKIKVIGTSRVALEQNLEALYQALALRQQQLVLYATDARYFIADCTNVSCSLVGGLPISTTATVTFTCQQPFAFAATPSVFNTGTVTLNPLGAGGGNLGVDSMGGTSLGWAFPVQTFVGGGSVFARPLITITNQNPGNNVTLTTALTAGNNYTSLTVSALQAAVTIGDTFVLTSGTHTQSIVASNTSLQGSTALTVTSFNANFSYPGSGATTVQLNNIWTNLTVVQQTDNQTISITDPTVLPKTTGDSVYIFCDPTVTSDGYTVQLNHSGIPGAFVGIFPFLEATNNNWVITVVAVSPPVASATWTWSSRWLA